MTISNISTILSLGENNKSDKNEPCSRYTVRDLLLWAIKELKYSGIELPRLNAEVLLAHVLKCPHTDLYIYPERLVDRVKVNIYSAYIQKRTQGVPFQYITNHTEFMSLDFYVDERVLIPRPETEFLVEAVIERAKNFAGEPEIEIVDIGTGSGNISVSLAKNIENARIFAIDTSRDALAVAKINAQKHQVMHKITLLCGDIFEPLQHISSTLNAHFIVSNPPYIAAHEFSTLQQEVRCHEPYGALISGDDGLLFFKRIIADAEKWLRPGGFLLFEVAEKQARCVIKLIEKSNELKKIGRIKDYQKISRIVIAQKEECSGQDRY